MKLWQRSSLIITSFSLVVLSEPLFANATNCPLLPQNTYKSPASSAVYYITRNCTKRPFTSETAFFAYFTSWKQVRSTTAAILNTTPIDPKGPMTYRSSSTPISTPSLPVVPVSQPIQEPAPSTPTTTNPEPIPAVSVPVSAPQPTIIPPLRGPLANFLRCPTASEQNFIEQNFKVVWDKAWDSHPFTCDYQTKSPSRLAVYATLRALHDIEFQKPLPFTNNKSLFEFLTAQKLTITLGQNCQEYSSGINFAVYLNGTFSRTHGVRSGTVNCDWIALGQPELLNEFVANPLHKLGLFVHEAHHAIVGSQHPNANGSDTNIDDNSAWAAQFYYYAWLHLYADTLDTTTKQEAKNAALSILHNRFSGNRCPANPDLKKVVNTISPGLCL